MELRVLLAAQEELAIANLETTPMKKDRLAHIETALIKSLLIWQRAESMQKQGSGSVADEAKARAAVFKFRAMWLAEKADGSQQSQTAQDGIPANVGNGSLPPGLEGATDLIAIKKRRIETLQFALQVSQNQNTVGLIDIFHTFAPHIELAIANLDLTTSKKERLAHIETALVSSLLAWQYLDARRKHGVDDNPIREAKARADVFKLRAMWLAEKAEDSR
jgi:hypothetical protein